MKHTKFRKGLWKEAGKFLGQGRQCSTTLFVSYSSLKIQFIPSRNIYSVLIMWEAPRTQEETKVTDLSFYFSSIKALVPLTYRFTGLLKPGV